MEHQSTETQTEQQATPKSVPVVKRSKTSFKALVAGLIGALVLIWIGVGATVLYQYLTSNHAPLTDHATTKDDGNALTSSAETTISAVASKVSPSIVSIVTQLQSSSRYSSGLQEAAGSGVIVSSDGVVLTNKHVVSSAKKVQIVLSDGTEYDDVKILGTDPLNDLAFLKIENAKNLPAAELGDSSTIKIGQSVIAIGNALGEYHNTVTSGIISGLGRSLVASDVTGTSTESLSGLIQTDAAINSGNSGGPLLNTSGQVIGINTAIAQDAENMGFSIPINSAKGILKRVLAGKSVEHAYLGVRYVAVNAAVAKKYNLTTKTGAYVMGTNGQSAVVSGSPASKAGIKEGDVIIKINGLAVGERGDVSSLISEYAPGETIEVTLVRGKDTKSVKVTLEAYNSQG